MRKRKEPSRKDSVDLARAQIESILEEIRVAKQRMMPQWKLLRSFKNLKFADTWEGNQRERDVEKRSKKVREKYEKFLSFEERELYQKLFGKEPKVMAIHAGLECGLLGGVYKNWDMISFGPTIMHPHSPDEKVNIESVQKFWKFLVATLENVPVK